LKATYLNIMFLMFGPQSRPTTTMSIEKRTPEISKNDIKVPAELPFKVVGGSNSHLSS
jgi:hypothetical protein